MGNDYFNRISVWEKNWQFTFEHFIFSLLIQIGNHLENPRIPWEQILIDK